MYRLILIGLFVSTVLASSKAALLVNGKRMSMIREEASEGTRIPEDAVGEKLATSPSASPTATTTPWPSPTASSSATGSPFNDGDAGHAGDVTAVARGAPIARSRQLLSTAVSSVDEGECSDRVAALTAAVTSAEEELAAARRLIQRLEGDLAESREASLLWPTPEKLATQLQSTSEALDSCRASAADDARALSALSMELSVCHAMAVQAAVIEESWPLSWPFSCLLWRALAGTAAFVAALATGLAVRHWSSRRKSAAGASEGALACPFPV